jgi:hypothetical protein
MLTRIFSLLCLFATAAWAADSDTLSASALATHFHSAEAGNSYVRLKMETKSGVMQIQIKARRSGNNAELVYQVLWPKEHKGESVLLRKSGGSESGTLFTPPSTSRPLDASQMSGAFFGSDLSYEDLLDDFFGWPQQALTGTDTVDRVPCQILESKPGKGGSSYTSVRTWIDTRRMVPLRIEKYGAGGKLVRRFDTTRVANDDKGRPVPANFSVQGPGGGTTQLDGSKIHHDQPFKDDEFTPEGIKTTAIPHGSPD